MNQLQHAVKKIELSSWSKNGHKRLRKWPQLQRLVLCFILPTIAFSLASCSTNSSRFSSSRIEYNEAFQTTEQKELLLNIVRLRYNEPPAFLQVNGISSQFEFFSEVEVSTEIDGNGGLEFFGPGATIGFSSRPTVTFSPQITQQFTLEMMAPVDPEAIYRLVEYGWSLERVFALMVRRINEIGQPIGLDREYGQALDLQVGIFDQLGVWQRSRQLELELNVRPSELLAAIDASDVDLSEVIELRSKGIEVALKDGRYLIWEQEKALELLVRQSLVESEEWRSMADLLRLDGGAGIYKLDPQEQVFEDKFRIAIALRSPMEMMAFLSKGVLVPKQHLSTGVVADWAVTGGLDFFQVHSSSEEPEDSYLAVQHRGTWFYIARNDLHSRKTLGLMSSLIRQEVQAGGAENLPVLTLPVGR